MKKYAIGLMSGTSLDGIDAALVELEGYGRSTKCKLIAFESISMPEHIKDQIIASCVPETSRIDVICSLNMELGSLFSQAVFKVLESSKFEGKLDFIASHGQTIYHLPNPTGDLVKSTLQIGDPSQIAYDHRTRVVFNFRMMDVVDGGDGAPLVPYTEFVLYSNPEKNVLLQNIGGIGNVTVIPKNGTIDDVTAFDTGPGNMMMNAAMTYYYDKPYDDNGVHAKKGQLIPELLEELQAHPYLQQTPPKSTGREMFGEDVVVDICKRYKHADNVIHTLTYFTAKTITDAYKHFIEPTHSLDRIILGGGGAYNPTLVSMIRDLLPHAEVLVQEDLGLSSDAKEAVAFALLGNETVNNQASNVPNATGSKHPMILGQICPNPWPEKRID